MELLDAIHTRRSIRKYLSKTVPEEMIEIILKAGMAAPSAGNQQPWHFIVITDRASLDAIPGFHPYSKMVLQAPAAILVCGDPNGKKWPTFWDQDVSAATQNILLAARDLGLGTVWVGIYPEKDRMDGFRKLFALPDHIIPFALIPVGWPDGGFDAVNRFRPELIHQERWQSK
ncbi:MAG: nitroreductase family protein [Desulfomicrobium sp.]|nr:nitroreductase family protein [Pseudomonadota bacterium]MBV1711449.1 nitroreductase family protein [Desulfomicrobium sp.]MBU4570851.1 nitroreductase family protein [Pseudomonadota bacterium]MBU4595341.1 nitroreductase family protein [Pseudomonadota bacterium]MBV1720773.1 nitroreductase family protein [Desulfomicrobium sp.]